MKVEKPLLRGHFHQAMFFVSLGACALLVFQSSSQKEAFASAVYSIGVLLMFGVSALYHRINWPPQKRALMKRLDHSAIYIMIAGTFTPIPLLALPENSGMNLLIAIWIVAILGILQSIFFVNIPKMVSSVIYLIAGFLILPYLGDLAKSLGTLGLTMLIAGGAAYSIGALSYGLKRPKLNPTIFSYHEIFHVLVSIAAVFHFIMVYSLL